MKTLLEEVLGQIKPSEEDREMELRLGRKVMGRLRRILPNEIGLEMVGSVAKGTNLRQDRDIDIFMLFPKKYQKDELEKLGLRFAKKAVQPYKWEVGYAEHPYLRAEVDNCSIDIVPSYKIHSIHEKASSVDRSPLHTVYIMGKLSAKQKDEVRLLKQFLKRLGIYGAELKIEGFSGYLCELLIVQHGSFESLLKSAAGWREPIIDIEGHYIEESEIREKFKNPLIVLDPVDMNRNVAAATSKDSLAKFILAARAFLKKPGREFFFGKEHAAPKSELSREIRRRGTKFISLVFPKPDVVEDILWPQLKKAAKNIARHAELSGFKVFDCGVWSDGKSRCIMLFEFEVHTLPTARKIIGPAASYEKGVAQFIKKHKGRQVWVEGDRVVAMEERRITDAAELLKEIAKHPHEFGIPSHISRGIKKSRMFLDDSIVNEDFREFLGSYLSKKEFFMNSLA